MLFTANTKRGERGNAFKVVNHRGQLGHLQSELVDPLWSLHVATSFPGPFPCLGGGAGKALASAGHVPILHPEILGVIN